MVAVGAGYYVYLDILENWILFAAGLFALMLGLGGRMLVTPDKVVLSYPFYHHAGLLIGISAITVSLLTLLSRRGFVFVKLEIPIASVALGITGFSVGFLIDELIVWSEMPSVELYSKRATRNKAEENYALGFNNLIQLNYSRCLSCFIMATVCLCVLFFRLVILGLIIYDDLGSTENDFIEPEAGQPDEELIANMDDGMFGTKTEEPMDKEGVEGEEANPPPEKKDPFEEILIISGLFSCFCKKGATDKKEEDGEQAEGAAEAAPGETERTSGVAEVAAAAARSSAPAEAGANPEENREERKSGKKGEKKKKKKKGAAAAEEAETPKE
ncbi:unnamed protein product [Schistocephalus solidus]|uniref:DUF4203 domain-containing protein n=1 Tax=Schistocephalus solidus TaxID=70667 RepID=A0A183SXI4_SCHSO|nr:unnamed protein product [Schistocephalus solidus]